MKDVFIRFFLEKHARKAPLFKILSSLHQLHACFSILNLFATEPSFQRRLVTAAWSTNSRVLMNAIPKREQQEVAAELTGIFKQEKKEDALLNLTAFKAKHRLR